MASRLRSPTGVPFVLYGAPPTFVLVGPVRFSTGFPFVFIMDTLRFLFKLREGQVCYFFGPGVAPFSCFSP